MFYSINLSPLLVTKKGFMIIIIFEELPIVSTAFKSIGLVHWQRAYKGENKGHILCGRRFCPPNGTQVLYIF